MGSTFFTLTYVDLFNKNKVSCMWFLFICDYDLLILKNFN